MKNKLLFILFLSFSVSAQSQSSNSSCGTSLPAMEAVLKTEQAMVKQMQIQSSFPSLVTVPLKIHIIRNSDGSGGLSIADLNAGVAALNSFYTGFNMSYYVCGEIHYIDNTDFYSLNVDIEKHQLVLNNVDDAVNVYFANELSQGGFPINGVTSFPQASRNENYVFMKNSEMAAGITLAHEFGHYWNLFHTYETSFGHELVSGSNCSSAGDLLCDTPADPCCNHYNATTCTYTGTIKDANNQSYAPSLTNIMSGYGYCRNTFSPNQISRAVAGYSIRTALLGQYNWDCRPPAAAPTNLLASAIACGTRLTWQDNASNEMGYIIEFSSGIGWRGIGKVGAGVTTFDDMLWGITAGLTYQYRVVAANAQGQYSSVLSYVKYSETGCYCIPASTNCSEGDAITGVLLFSGSTTILEKYSDCSAGGYSFTGTAVPVLSKAATYSFRIERGLQYNVGLKIWIDYNLNGVFEAGEEVYSRSPSNWATSAGSFTVPANSGVGQTRMRVRIFYNAVPSDPCTNISSFGETEDYLLEIASGACTLAAPSVTNAERCGSGSVHLVSTGCSGQVMWHKDNSLVHTGASYTTPHLIANTSYEVYCQVGACISSSIPVSVTILNNLSFGGAIQTGNINYRVGQTITSQAKAQDRVGYAAGNSIELLPGFETLGVFRASIEDCQ